MLCKSSGQFTRFRTVPRPETRSKTARQRSKCYPKLIAADYPELVSNGRRDRRVCAGVTAGRARPRKNGRGVGAYRSAVPTPVIDPRLSTGWVSPERLQASPLRRTARSLLTSAYYRAGPPILMCWIKIGGPAPASQTRSRNHITAPAVERFRASPKLSGNARTTGRGLATLCSGCNGHSIEVEGSGYSDETVFCGFAAAGRGFAGYAQQAMPRMTSVDPVNGKAGDVIAVSGENLQKDRLPKSTLPMARTMSPWNWSNRPTPASSSRSRRRRRLRRGSAADGSNRGKGRQVHRTARQGTRSTNHSGAAPSPLQAAIRRREVLPGLLRRLGFGRIGNGLAIRLQGLRAALLSCRRSGRSADRCTLPYSGPSQAGGGDLLQVPERMVQIAVPEFDGALLDSRSSPTERGRSRGHAAS